MILFGLTVKYSREVVPPVCHSSDGYVSGSIILIILLAIILIPSVQARIFVSLAFQRARYFWLTKSAKLKGNPTTKASISASSHLFSQESPSSLKLSASIHRYWHTRLWK